MWLTVIKNLIQGQKKSKRFSILSSSLLQCLQRSSFFNLQNKSVVAKSSHPIPRYIHREMVE